MMANCIMEPAVIPFSQMKRKAPPKKLRIAEIWLNFREESDSLILNHSLRLRCVPSAILRIGNETHSLKINRHKYSIGRGDVEISELDEDISVLEFDDLSFIRIIMKNARRTDDLVLQTYQIFFST